MKLRWSQSRELLLCSSKRTIPLLAKKKKTIKSQFNDELFRQFHLIQNLCRDIEPSNWIVTVFLRKILTACSCLKQNLYENRMRQLLKSCEETRKKKHRVRIYSRHWVKQYNCYCLSEKNITACSCLWLDGQFKYRFAMESLIQETLSAETVWLRFVQF